MNQRIWPNICISGSPDTKINLLLLLTQPPDINSIINVLGEPGAEWDNNSGQATTQLTQNMNSELG